MYGEGDDAWGEGEGVVEKQLKENQRIFNYFILNQNESQITWKSQIQIIWNLTLTIYSYCHRETS